MVRTYAMGVFAGEIQPESTETLVVLKNARRIWWWEGAATLSELATEGTAKPEKCKFPCEQEMVYLTSPQGFEITPITERARASIASVPVWSSQ